MGIFPSPVEKIRIAFFLSLFKWRNGTQFSEVYWGPSSTTASQQRILWLWCKLKKKWKSGHLRFIWGAGVRKKLRHWHIPFLLLIFYLASALIVSYGKNFPLFSLRAHTKTFFLVIMRTMTSHEAASAARVTGVFSAFVVSEHCSETMSEKVHHTLLNDSDEKKTKQLLYLWLKKRNKNNYYVAWREYFTRCHNFRRNYR